MRYLTTIIGLAFLMLLSVASSASAAMQSGERGQELGSVYSEVNFFKGQRIDSLVKLVEQYGLRPVMLEGDFAIGTEHVHDFYPIRPDQQYDEIEGRYRDARRHFLLDMLSQDLANSHFQDDLLEQRVAMNNALHSEVPIEVSKLIIVGSYKDVYLFSVRNSAIIERLEVLVDAREQKPRKGAVVEKSHTTPSTWYPNSGRTSTDESGAEGERFVVQYMKWNKHSFGSNATYEHDFFLYNYNNDGTYLSSSTTPYPDCIPKATYLSTTWPSSAKPYLDTRFYFDRQRTGCEKNEMPYTIGAAKASALENGKTYYTYIRTVKGTVDRDRFKVQAQLGHRSPLTCYSTWCSYGDQRTTLIPAWSDKVPGYVTWTKP